ncbi:hypothetical protein BKA69DRAFT_51115 [Paraphysoderma sedebokerense]|nr:hypothetical protein BKA69DRAFT_51115 [Paraphysoderma sedebokerense]
MEVIEQLVATHVRPNINLIFDVANTSVLPVWAMVALIPDSKITSYSVKLSVLISSFAYLATVPELYIKNGKFHMPDFMTFKGVRGLINHATPQGATAMWVHYLAFDLFVGYQIAKHASKHGIPKILSIPCVFFTMMAGPIGLLLYTFVAILHSVKSVF